MNRETPIDPAKTLFDAACKPAGFVGLIGVVNSGKGPLLEQLKASLVEHLGANKVMSVPLFADAGECLRTFISSDCIVLVMREFREIDGPIIERLLSTCRNKVVVAGLHPGVDYHIEKANRLETPIQFIEIAGQDDLSPHVVGTA